jgi:hypothetical protein
MLGKEEEAEEAEEGTEERAEGRIESSEELDSKEFFFADSAK